MDDKKKTKKKVTKKKTTKRERGSGTEIKNILNLGIGVGRPTRDHPKAEKEFEAGLECKKCGCRHFYVDRTKKAMHKKIRYVHCRNCGTRHVTIERIVG